MFVWTEHRVNKLKELWRTNLSAGQIGKKMGTTRNSILGKITRLGLHNRCPFNSHPGKKGR